MEIEPVHQTCQARYDIPIVSSTSGQLRVNVARYMVDNFNSEINQAINGILYELKTSKSNNGISS